MRTKLCSGVCGKRLPLDETHFAFKSKIKRVFRSDCKTCYNQKRALKYKRDPVVVATTAARNDSYRKRGRDVIIEYLKTHPCVDCGETNGIVLEFDHVKGDKIKSVAALVSDKASVDKITKEIEKCEVVCANCHRKRTAKTFGWDVHYQ